MSDARCQIRHATACDADTAADLAAELAQSFTFSRTRFEGIYPALLAADDAGLLLAVDGQERLGYLLGFQHLAFYANGPAGWVEEVFVRRQDRGRHGAAPHRKPRSGPAGRRHDRMFRPRMVVCPVRVHSCALESQQTPSRRVGQDCTKASRSALIVSASVVGMPCGNPWYVFSVPFCTSRADSGPESA